MALTASAQTVVNGVIHDSETQEPVPFAYVLFSGTQIGGISDATGHFEVETSKPVDSITVSYVGYNSKTVAIISGKRQQLSILLDPETVSLDEVVVRPGENPAFRVLRKVVAHKKANDKRKLDAYEYQSYTKNELYLNHMPDAMTKAKVIQKAMRVVDTVESMKNADGETMLPIFFSETFSRYYYRRNPILRKEVILKSNVTGVTVDNGQVSSQFSGSSFQEYNFYKNWLNILDKDFVSPICDGWKIYYDYELEDSVKTGGKTLYKITFTPKRSQDLAFEGTMWIAKGSYALDHIEAQITKNANINYVKGLAIQQSLSPVAQKGDTAWLPSKTKVQVDVDKILGLTSGFKIQFEVINQDFRINDPMEKNFYDVPIALSPDALQSKPGYWEAHRPVDLSKRELQVKSSIEDISKIKAIRFYSDALTFFLVGYWKTGPVDLGPYQYTYAYNDIEGNRLQIGLRTNEDFSDKWELSGYFAYGFKDREPKYRAQVRYFPSKNPYTVVGAYHMHDIQQVALQDIDPEYNPFFYASSRFGTLRKPYVDTENDFYIQRDLTRGLSTRVGFQYKNFDPLYDFQYQKVPGDSLSNQTGFQTSEIQFQLRYAKGERWLWNGNNRVSLGTLVWPIFTLDYQAGIKGVLGSDFNYHRISLNIRQEFNAGAFGMAQYNLSIGKVFSTVPYPLLKVHAGNESFFFSDATFNLMNYFEFASDTYVSLKYEHYFEGLIMNRIPLMRKLKWRLVGLANIIYGGVDQKNLALTKAEFGDSQGFYSLQSKPYIEVGYGIENIFKVLRVDFYHRITYLDHPNVNKFGVKMNFQLIL